MNGRMCRTGVLLILMALSGMPIPADSSSRFPLIQSLLVDIGDELKRLVDDNKVSEMRRIKGATEEGDVHEASIQNFSFSSIDKHFDPQHHQ